MEKLLIILFYIPIIAAAQNIFVNYSAPFPPPPAPSCGTQVWASANLNAGTQVTQAAYYPQPAGGKWCYNDVAANCTIYGGLYDWNNAAGLAAGSGGASCDPCGTGGIQGMCPAGYHIPADLEWSRWEYCIEDSISPKGTTTLSDFQTIIGWRGSAAMGVGPGDKMKAANTYAIPWDGTNSSGFLALPAGLIDVGYSGLGSSTLFWTATEQSNGFAWLRELDTGTSQSSRGGIMYGGSEEHGFSVRCLHN